MHMTSAVKDSCDLLISYYNAADRAFLMEHSSLLLGGALLYMNENREVDPAVLKSCREILRREENIFSLYRSTAELSLIFLMSLSEDPLAVLKRVEHVTEKIATFWSRSEALSAAMTIVSGCATPFEYDEKVLQTRELLQEMDRVHPMLTGENDLPFAALLAVNETYERDLLEEAEKCYRYLRKEVKTSHECAQIMSLILSIYPKAAHVKVGKIKAIAEGLRTSSRGLTPNRTAAILAILTEAEGARKDIIKDLLEAEDHLCEFYPAKGLFGIGYTNRRLAATFLIALLRSHSQRLSPAAVSVMTSLFIDSVAQRSSC